MTKTSTKTVKTNVKKSRTKTSNAKSKTKDDLFTKDSTLGEVVAKKPEAEAVLLGFGMHCIGCFVSQFETLEEASQVHGVELDLLLKKLNEL